MHGVHHTAPGATTRIFPEDWLNPLPLHDLFPNRQPLDIDLGCGKGRFLLAYANHHPGTNLLGIDRMLRRIRKVDRKAVRAKLQNVRLLRMEAYYATVYLVPPESVRTYFIFFPDPWPKKRHHKNRLFNEPFLEALARTLIPGGAVHLATDHQPYFDEVAELLANDPRFEACAPFLPTPDEQTDFEQWYAGKKEIHRVSVGKR